MRRAKRIRAICAALLPCESFADVGCDHGYCTQFMLENGLCRFAVVSDISAGSLAKAERLLAAYIRAGSVRSVCCAGLEHIPREIEQVLIAGMGGDEIADILSIGFLPPVLVLQPMRNARRVRELLFGSGYAITLDYTFRDGKFYDLLRAEKAAAPRAYGERELEFGYDNIHSPGADFAAWAEEELAKCERRLAAAGQDVPALRARAAALSEVKHELARSLR